MARFKLIACHAHRKYSHNNNFYDEFPLIQYFGRVGEINGNEMLRIIHRAEIKYQEIENAQRNQWEHERVRCKIGYFEGSIGCINMSFVYFIATQRFFNWKGHTVFVFVHTRVDLNIKWYWFWHLTRGHSFGIPATTTATKTTIAFKFKCIRTCVNNGFLPMFFFSFAFLSFVKRTRR